MLRCETPNYGVSAARGVVCEGVCGTVAPVSRWAQLGSLERGHTLPGQSQLLGDPPHTGMCVWNCHSWTFIPISGEGSRMSPCLCVSGCVDQCGLPQAGYEEKVLPAKGGWALELPRDSSQPQA